MSFSCYDLHKRMAWIKSIEHMEGCDSKEVKGICSKRLASPAEAFDGIWPSAYSLFQWFSMREAKICRNLKQHCHVKSSHSVLTSACLLLQGEASVRPVEHVLTTSTSQTVMQVPRIPEFKRPHTAFFSRSPLPRVDHSTTPHTPRPRAVNVRGLSLHRVESGARRKGKNVTGAQDLSPLAPPPHFGQGIGSL